ncbi:hypothetical protein KYG33_18105 [Chryseobacterium sp. D764]|jgi:hypothetical protein|uniref:hypothetical protein n=1 Tax=unclassified Chryseobacterium TaxID=2593645 RepID=UPI0009849698|nr:MULTISPECIES: hypothetical protein [unclassified Chryseobacterium]QXU48675.1 hypothetical protein KYG33_18105 [Chryseobacterium sp. D764]CAD0223455.1 conserved exported protein of unknown function [Chryseobacterium sp. JV274]
MKKLSILMLAVSSTMVFAQKVSDYKYVSVPEKFETFKEDYGLKNFFIKALAGKKYIVLPVIKDNWPAEAKSNFCNVVNADVINDKNLFKNKVIVQFKDCNNNLILESKGGSKIKEYEEGLQDAIKEALIKIPLSNPVAFLPASTKGQNTSPEPAVSVASTTTPEANSYSNGKLDLQKIQIDPNQFILAKSGSSVPFAAFKTTSKNSVFIVKLADGNTTLGYFENGSIVIDIPQADGRYSKEVFVAK